MNIEVLSAFIAAATLANGTYKESEKMAVSSMAKELKINEQNLLDAIDKEVEKQKKLSDVEFDKYFAELATKITPQESIIIFESCIEIVLSDGELCKDEAIVLSSFGEVLNIEPATLILMIANIVRDVPELVVNLEGK